MANPNDADQARRKMVGGIGVAAVAATVGGSAEAGPVASTAEETANLAIAAAFCSEWTKEPVDVERMVKSYFTEDCIVRVLDSTMVARGWRATVGMFSGWLEGGRRFDLKVLRSAALGPVVVQVRADTISKGGNTGKPDATAAVFVMGNRKIRELSDYFTQ